VLHLVNSAGTVSWDYTFAGIVLLLKFSVVLKSFMKSKKNPASVPRASYGYKRKEVANPPHERNGGEIVGASDILSKLVGACILLTIILLITIFPFIKTFQTDVKNPLKKFLLFDFSSCITLGLEMVADKTGNVILYFLALASIGASVILFVLFFLYKKFND
jgi:uncharacterized membrane protein YeaQ/YmgE (transglycosylase-associated protein family)